jgi:hypothetical protein
MKTKKFWTDVEIEYLKANFPENYTKDICEHLGRSYSSVSAQAHVLKLHKSDQFNAMELQHQGKRLKLDGAKFRFSKGHKPLNKGKKMSAQVYEKAKPTMFKKGQVPLNTKPDGYESIDVDGYIKIKSQGKMRYKHRILWEQHNGALEKFDVVRFKDGNPLNCVIENLELVTRNENMVRNTIHRFPEEVKSTIKLLSQLKKKIKDGTEQNCRS